MDARRRDDRVVALLRLGGSFACLLATCVLGGCIDTAPGLVVDVRNGAVTVTSDEEVAVSVTMGVRVGKHALDARSFIVPQVGLFVDGAAVAEVNLDRPTDFDGMLDPGDSTTVQLTGRTLPGAFDGVRASLCSASEVELVATWRADVDVDEGSGLPSTEAGTARGTTHAIDCP